MTAYRMDGRLVALVGWVCLRIAQCWTYASKRPFPSEWLLTRAEAHWYRRAGFVRSTQYAGIWVRKGGRHE